MALLRTWEIRHCVGGRCVGVSVGSGEHGYLKQKLESKKLKLKVIGYQFLVP